MSLRPLELKTKELIHFPRNREGPKKVTPVYECDQYERILKRDVDYHEGNLDSVLRLTWVLTGRFRNTVMAFTIVHVNNMLRIHAKISKVVPWKTLLLM